MKTVEEQIAFLRAHSSPHPQSGEKRQNGAEPIVTGFLRKIAIQTAMALEEKEMSQRQLAESMGCSPQYVSRLLKGEENLSLETICKLENALQEPIMQAVFA